MELQLKLSTEILRILCLSFSFPSGQSSLNCSRSLITWGSTWKNSSGFFLVILVSSGNSLSMRSSTSDSPEWLLQMGSTPAAIDSTVTMPKASAILLGTTQTLQRGRSWESRWWSVKPAIIILSLIFLSILKKQSSMLILLMKSPALQMRLAFSRSPSSNAFRSWLICSRQVPNPQKTNLLSGLSLMRDGAIARSSPMPLVLMKAPMYRMILSSGAQGTHLSGRSESMTLWLQDLESSMNFSLMASISSPTSSLWSFLPVGSSAILAATRLRNSFSLSCTDSEMLNLLGFMPGLRMNSLSLSLSSSAWSANTVSTYVLTYSVPVQIFLAAFKPGRAYLCRRLWGLSTQTIALPWILISKLIPVPSRALAAMMGLNTAWLVSTLSTLSCQQTALRHWAVLLM